MISLICSFSFRQYAMTIPRPFSVHYNPYTQTMDVINGKEQIVNIVRTIRSKKNFFWMNFCISRFILLRWYGYGSWCSSKNGNYINDNGLNFWFSFFFFCAIVCSFSCIFGGGLTRGDLVLFSFRFLLYTYKWDNYLLSVDDMQPLKISRLHHRWVMEIK
jgi:hypothetical protein